MTRSKIPRVRSVIVSVMFVVTAASALAGQAASPVSTVSKGLTSVPGINDGRTDV